MITKKMISAWFDGGIEQGATHMIIVCDMYDLDDYPVYVTLDEDVRVIEAHYTNKNMQKVMEVYNLQMEKQPQLDAVRSFNH